MVQLIPSDSRNMEEASVFSELAKEFYEPVYHFIARQSPNQEDAADITQQTFVKAFKSFSRYNRERAFAPWIYTIARRCVADFYRQRRQETLSVDEAIADPEPGPREQASTKESADNLWELARELKVKHYQVLLLHYKENFSLRETAEIMGLSLTYTKVMLFRARVALKQRIEANPSETGDLS